MRGVEKSFGATRALRGVTLPYLAPAIAAAALLAFMSAVIFLLLLVSVVSIQARVLRLS